MKYAMDSTAVILKTALYSAQNRDIGRSTDKLLYVIDARAKKIAKSIIEQELDNFKQEFVENELDKLKQELRRELKNGGISLE